MPRISKNISQIKHIQTSGEVGFGIVTYLPGGRIWPRIQRHYQLVVVHEGSMRVEVGRRTHHCAAGEGILLGPGHEEQFFFSGRRSTTHSWCQAPPEAIAEGWWFQPGMIARPARCSAWLLEFMGEGLKIPRDPMRTAEMGKSALAAVLCAMWNFCSNLPQSGRADKPLPEPLHKAWEMMQRRLADALPLTEIARAAGVSKTHLINLAKKQWGLTPSEYLWQMRIGEASRLLRETGLNIGEIAYRTGFSNPFHFSRRFKARFKKSPADWRKVQWGYS